MTSVSEETGSTCQWVEVGRSKGSKCSNRYFSGSLVDGRATTLIQEAPVGRGRSGRGSRGGRGPGPGRKASRGWHDAEADETPHLPGSGQQEYVGGVPDVVAHKQWLATASKGASPQSSLEKESGPLDQGKVLQSSEASNDDTAPTVLVFERQSEPEAFDSGVPTTSGRDVEFPHSKGQGRSCTEARKFVPVFMPSRSNAPGLPSSSAPSTPVSNPTPQQGKGRPTSSAPSTPVSYPTPQQGKGRDKAARSGTWHRGHRTGPGRGGQGDTIGPPAGSTQQSPCKEDINSEEGKVRIPQDSAKAMPSSENVKEEGQNPDLNAKGGEEGGAESLALAELAEEVAGQAIEDDPDWEQNNQEQADEVMALESIFGSDFLMLSEEGQQRVFQIIVKVELPSEELRLVAHFPKDQHEETISTTSPTSQPSSSEAAESAPPAEAATPTFAVNHLPPLRLICALPASYPSRDPPRFQLRCLWLTAKQLSVLCEGLDKVWEEQGAGLAVVYSWVDWLGRETFPQLGLNKDIDIGAEEVPIVTTAKGKEPAVAPRDPRGLPEGCGLDNDLPRLLRYNEEQKAEAFRNALHECTICFTEYPGADFVRLRPGCGHYFCRTCLAQMAEVHVTEGAVTQLICPDTTCRQPMPPSVLRELLTPDQFQRWEDLTLQRTLDSMADLVYCPRCETPCIEEEDNHAQCEKCFFSFCGLCYQNWHVGTPCLTPDARLRVLQERQKGRVAGDDQKRREQALVNEVLSMKYVIKETKQCPSCKMAIQKAEGCNKMTCFNCGAFFCYKCGKAIKGYEHFREGSCILFETEMIDAWEVQWNRQVQEARGQAEARMELWPNRTRLCPNCRQRNPKEGNNNHIRCWACTRYFCGFCHQMVRGTGHYGPRGCKQHTPD